MGGRLHGLELQVQPRQMAALPCAGVEKHRAAPGTIVAHPGPSILAAPVMADAAGHAGRDFLDPVQQPLGIAVFAVAAGDLAEQSAAEQPLAVAERHRDGRILPQHPGMKSGVDEEQIARAQPRRGLLQRRDCRGAQFFIDLRQGAGKFRADRDFSPGERAQQFQLVVAEQEYATAFTHQIERETQAMPAVRTAVDQVVSPASTTRF